MKKAYHLVTLKKHVGYMYKNSLGKCIWYIEFIIGNHPCVTRAYRGIATDLDEISYAFSNLDCSLLWYF
jgi:hypothetical protein